MTLNDQKRIIDLWVQFWGGNEMAFSQLYCLCIQLTRDTIRKKKNNYANIKELISVNII